MSKPLVITHSGHFQPDDIFAVATLSLVLKGDFELIRTRDMEVIKTGDYVVDVGLMYDPSKNRFDHHQIGGAGVRANGIPYSSFGLVWKHYGEQLCGSREVMEMIDQSLVQTIDANDNGVSIYQKKTVVEPYGLFDAFGAFNRTWNEEQDFDSVFVEASKTAMRFLEREIFRARSKKEAKQLVQAAYEKSEDKRIIVLDADYPSDEVLSVYEEPLYVIKPEVGNVQWKVKAVRNDSTQFENRKSLPIDWAGKNGTELADITGVPDAVFCHNHRFVAAAKSKEGAIRLAQIAVAA
jgi:uncharacterized UPF0160 family protein